jgi:hypothetical protein
MPLPHFTKIYGWAGSGTPGVEPYPQEPIYKNLFEITFVLPVILQSEGRDPFLLLLNAKSIAAELTPDITAKEQRFKFSTRNFVTMPDKTHVDFDIKFELNQSENLNMTIWNYMRRWYDLVWNSQDGRTFYKSDIIGTIIVNHHDKKGFVIRRVTFHNCQIKGIASIFELDWSQNADIMDVNAKFTADYWTDEFYDANRQFAIGNTPRISEYL